jgi:hypothetical protein
MLAGHPATSSNTHRNKIIGNAAVSPDLQPHRDKIPIRKSGISNSVGENFKIFGMSNPNGVIHDSATIVAVESLVPCAVAVWSCPWECGSILSLVFT